MVAARLHADGRTLTVSIRRSTTRAGRRLGFWVYDYAAITPPRRRHPGDGLRLLGGVGCARSDRPAAVGRAVIAGMIAASGIRPSSCWTSLKIGYNWPRDHDRYLSVDRRGRNISLQSE